MFLFSCNSNNNEILKNYDLSIGEHFEQLDFNTKNQITNIDIIIEGKSNNNLQFIYSHPPFDRKETLELENGVIKERMKVDWYENSIKYQILNKDNIKNTGQLKIKIKWN